MFLKKKRECHLANLKLVEKNLVFQNFGNLSVRLNEKNIIIKPSGVDLNKIRYKDYPIVHMDGSYRNLLKPSVDTDFHLEIYKNFKNINCVIHTHSKYATIWAQSCTPIPNLGTTHSDYWLTNIPVTKKLTKKEIKNNYEKNIGKSIVYVLKNFFCCGLLIANHGAICIGENVEEAILNAQRLEYVAELAYKTKILNKKSNISKDLVLKHFFRKNGQKSYYGQ